MVLAQRGLPRSDSAGYELFDNLGSLGLTSFMQQVTKVRALEGELARSIQLIDGIRAARVHLALKAEGSFRSSSDRASASVVVRADHGSGERAANAIRQLVASAIPGLDTEHVTVMSADGTVLASAQDSISAAPERLIGLERALAADIEARIVKTFSPYLGVNQFRVSVTAKLNADRRQTSETVFDPNSRVERSVRTIKESGEAENASRSDGVTVEQNIPVEDTKPAGGDNSRERTDRKEELTNYEVNSKSVSTTSDGYGIERLSVAVVVNRAQIQKFLGDGSTDAAIAARIEDLKLTAATAAGLSTERGDEITIAAVDFVDEETILPPVEEGGLLEIAAGNLGNLINAVTLIAVSVIVLFLGLRPAVRMITASAGTTQAGTTLDSPGQFNALPAGEGLAMASSPLDDAMAALSPPDDGDPLLDSLARGVARSPRDRLTKIVELDPDRAVEVLKQWLNEAEDRAA
jgi:flagellar M-ring protein FliF